MASAMMLVPRLALAALVSGAAAGLLMTLAIVLGAMLAGGGGWHLSTGAFLIAGLGAGLEIGVIVASLPAFLAGAAMCALGRRFDSARRVPAWLAAGAVGGALTWALFAAAARIVIGEPGLARSGLLLAAMLAGSGAALAFRAVVQPEAKRP